MFKGAKIGDSELSGCWKTHSALMSPMPVALAGRGTSTLSSGGGGGEREREREREERERERERERRGKQPKKRIVKKDYTWGRDAPSCRFFIKTVGPKKALVLVLKLLPKAAALVKSLPDIRGSSKRRYGLWTVTKVVVLIWHHSSFTSVPCRMWQICGKSYFTVIPCASQQPLGLVAENG